MLFLWPKPSLESYNQAWMTQTVDFSCGIENVLLWTSAAKHEACGSVDAGLWLRQRKQNKSLLSFCPRCRWDGEERGREESKRIKCGSQFTVHFITGGSKTAPGNLPCPPPPTPCHSRLRFWEETSVPSRVALAD